MMLNDMLIKLDKLFISRYGKRFAELNRNVYPTAKNDKGNFEVPIVIVGPNGGTLIKGAEGAFALNPPAVVSLQFRNMKPEQLVYRLSIPFDECKIAADKEEYFNYLFDEIVGKALNNYAATVGKPDKVRFGTCYAEFQRPGTNKEIFKQLEDSSLELRFYGEWSSNEEAYD